MNKFLLENWQSILMLVGGVIAWLFKIPLSKWILRQSQADVKATEVSTDTNTINNLEKSMNIYIALIDDIGNKLKEKDQLIETLTNQIHELKIEIEILTDKLNEFINKNI